LRRGFEYARVRALSHSMGCLGLCWNQHRRAPEVARPRRCTAGSRQPGSIAESTAARDRHRARHAPVRVRT